MQSKTIIAAVEKFGDKQLVKASEELQELGQACCRRYLGYEDKNNNFEEELADAEIMIEQLKLMCNSKKYEQWKEYKLKRLEEMIQEG